jgi:hypothetical protein
MLRRSLFWGLTLVLVVALTNLIIRGCRLEKEEAQKRVETTEEAKPTATRVLAPQDLSIVESKMELATKLENKKTFHLARHEVEIHNGGNVSYKDIKLRFVYLDSSGKKLQSRTYSIAQTIVPGATLKLADIFVSDIPPAAASFQSMIVYADIAAPSSPKQ